MENQMSEFRHGFYENNRNGIVKTVVDEQEYKITAALPGFSKEEIAVKLSGNNLEINAKHVTQDNSDNADNKDTGVKKPKDEIKYTVSIPADIDRSNITAQLNNGILTIKFSRIMDQTPIETKEILID